MNTQNQLNRVDNKQESVSAPSPGQISGLGCSTRNENSNNDVATLGSLNLQGAGGFSVTGQWGTNFQPLKNGDGTTMSSVERASRGRNDVQPPIPQPIMPSKQTLSLRKWIQHTSHSIGEKISTLYMECCLKIAISLTEQILQAEKLASCGIQDNLALLPIRNNVDWAKYTRITLGQTGATYEQLAQKSEFEDTVSDIAANLETNIDVPNLTDQSCATDVRYKSDQESDSNRPGKKDASQDSVCNTPIAFDWESGAMIGLNEHDANASDEKSLQNLQLDSCEASISNSTEEEGDQRLNKQLDAFVERLCEDDVEVGEVSEETYKDQWGSASNNFVDRGETNQCLKFPDSNTIPTNYYLNIDSVQIECPESSFRKYADNVENTLREKRQRIFYLALLFYELFSEGIVPDSNMCAIAISDGAFVSLPTLTLAEEIESNDNTFSEPKRCRGPAGSGRNISLCKLCFERLKFMGIPGPICHLIFNMLDSVYGDLSGEESYNEMSDVKFDLQLMLRKPKFLRGLDMNELSSSSCLQFYSNSVLREEELQVIKSCYQRCQSGSSEIAIIKGESGSGKTWLAHRVGSFIVVGGGLFLMGKFDQLQQRRPFSALASAFDQYCDILVSQKESFWAETVVRMLNSTFGQDISYLINLIPKLGEIVKCNASSLAFSSDNDKDSDFGNNMERIKYLLCQFVEIINANSVASSITLFLDDLQWADEASIAVINRLVLSQARKKFFFLGCYRDDEMDNDHPFWKTIEGVRAYGINTIISHTKRLTEDALNDVISDMLSLSPRIVRSLSRLVFSKTKGNFLFISQLLLSLSRDGLLRIDLGRQRWIWDHSKIYSTKLPDNVAVCFTNGIKKLPMEVQLALHTLSMFGASAKLDCIAVLESDLNVTIIEPLQKAAAEGLVNEIGGFFQFCHDKIQEACYELIQDHDRCCNHLTYGRCIIKRALVVGDDEMLFTALNQINIGGPSAVTDKSEYYIMATHNLTAARKATEMSDFHTAYSFCDNGITFLRKTHWRDHYEFSLQLFDLASSCALAVGNHQDLRILSDHVLRNAHCFEHKLNIYFFMISSQALTSKTSDALNEGLGILSQLGENIPSIPSQLMVDQQMQQTLAIIGGVSEDNLLNYRVMFDTQKLAAMRFLAKLQNIAFFVNQILHSYIVLRMVQITVSYGKHYVEVIYEIKHVQFGLLFTLFMLILSTRAFAAKSSGHCTIWIHACQTGHH